jgi:hypothetical protein
MLPADVLFIALVFLTLTVWTAVGVFSLRGRGSQAARWLRRWAFGAAVYFGMVVLASLLLPRQIVPVGESRCSDDWCISIEAVAKTPSSGGVRYLVTFRIASRARRAPQRETDVVAYLTDSADRRYSALPLDPSESAFDVSLQPGQSIVTKRAFEAPANADGLGVVVTHEGGFPISWFLIGYENWFRKPAITPIS